MLLEANQKLLAEMEQGKKYVKVIGHYLLDHLKKNPVDAAAIMTEGKTIKGSIDAMRNEATKPDNGGMLADAEGYAVILEYFGINGHAQASTPVQSTKIETDDLF